jgi:hypothetical protein
MAKQIRDYRTMKPSGTDTELNSNTDLGSDINNNCENINNIENIVEIDEESIDSDADFYSRFQELPPQLPERFYMVQSLYRKYFLSDTIDQFNVLYAFVMLAKEKWSIVDEALREGEKNYKF